jgi:hypothetical protein
MLDVAVLNVTDAIALLIFVHGLCSGMSKAHGKRN